MHPHPQDGSPGRFQGAGCVADHLGSFGHVALMGMELLYCSTSMKLIADFHLDWA